MVHNRQFPSNNKVFYANIPIIDLASMYRFILLLALIMPLAGCAHRAPAPIAVPPTQTEPIQQTQTPPNFRAQLLAQGLLPSSKASPCDQAARGDGISQIYPLTGTVSLFEVVCFHAAYQSVFAYFLVTDSDATTAKLVVFRRDDQPNNSWETVTGLTDFADNKLHVSYKGRGLGDCGSQEDYTLTGEVFTLDRLQEKECENNLEENIVIDPSTWPVTYVRKN